MRFGLLLCFFLMLSPSAATAATATGIDGNELLTWCDRPTDESFPVGMCIGYIQAAVQVALDTKTACMTAGLTLSRHKDIAVAYLKANPNARHDAAWRLVGKALAEKYPCPAP
jgi:hypothetical protein